MTILAGKKPVYKSIPPERPKKARGQQGKDKSRGSADRKVDTTVHKTTVHKSSGGGGGSGVSTPPEGNTAENTTHKQFSIPSTPKETELDSIVGHNTPGGVTPGYFDDPPDTEYPPSYP